MSKRAKLLAISAGVLSLLVPSVASADLSAVIRNKRLTLVSSRVLTQPIAAAPCKNQIEQAFPLNGPEQTRWRICWRITPNDAGRSAQLVMGPVSFRKSPSAPFMKLFHDARVAEIHVPYFSGAPRFFDIAQFTFPMETLTQGECPASAGGTLVSPNVCVERRDRGVMWRDGFAQNARRGEEIIVWGALDAANYSYIQSYAFRDDGTVVGRVGATGQNFGGSMEGHAHNAVWRLDIDLGGTSNRVDVRRHVESAGPNSTGSTNITTLNNAAKIDWKPQEFTTLGIGNTALKNGRGIPSGYHLLPIIESGLSRHSEPFTQADFWVTKYDATFQTASELPAYIAQNSLVKDRDLIVWLKNSALHHPRTEDGVTVNGQWIGTTHTMWSGFMMMPHDVFDCAPFYQQPCP